MRLLFVLAIGGACGLAPGNVTDDAAVVSERWWGGDDAADDVVDDGAREHFCRGSKIARYREETNVSSSCAVVEAYCGGRGEGLFQYMHLRYCALGAAPRRAVALLALWLLLLISLLATTADCYFVPQLEALSGYLQLSPEVAGITLLALGNGAPDVFAARAALSGGASDFPLMLSDLLGASVFISTVVLGSVLLAADRARAAWRVDRRVFLRDVCVYVGAVLSIFFVACDGTVELWEALLFLVIYAAYIAVVVVQSRAAAPVAPDALPRHPAAAAAPAPLDAPLLPVDAAAPPKVAGAPMAGLDWGLVRDGPAWAKMAVASCFGSPLLNDILGVGVATTAYAAKHGALASPLNAQDRVAYAFLLASLLSSLAAFPALGFFAEEKTAARARYPYALFGLYGAFALVSCLVELDVIPQDRICALGNGGSCLRTSS
ncbi:calcium:sodium antiporter [Aureococcus anophagefferens]|nr:calcium:sodium antiporter [Aureococcus anophagefferens]